MSGQPRPRLRKRFPGSVTTAPRSSPVHLPRDSIFSNFSSRNPRPQLRFDIPNFAFRCAALLRYVDTRLSLEAGRRDPHPITSPARGWRQLAKSTPKQNPLLLHLPPSTTTLSQHLDSSPASPVLLELDFSRVLLTPRRRSSRVCLPTDTSHHRRCHFA